MLAEMNIRHNTNLFIPANGQKVEMVWGRKLFAREPKRNTATPRD